MCMHVVRDVISSVANPMDWQESTNTLIKVHGCMLKHTQDVQGFAESLQQGKAKFEVASIYGSSILLFFYYKQESLWSVPH